MTDKVYLKIVLLGKVNSGKTCLVTRYITDTFSPEQPSTIGAAFCRKDITVEGRILSLAIWDTAGAERYQAMSSMYYRNAKAAVICFDKFLRRRYSTSINFNSEKVYEDEILEKEDILQIFSEDLTDKPSFEKAEYWVNQILTNEPNCKIYLCGTKVDLIHDEILQRAVPQEIVENYAKGRNSEVFETSSKSGVNVANLFDRMAYSFLVDSDLLPGAKNGIKLQVSNAQKSSCC